MVGGKFPGVSKNWKRGKLVWRFKRHVGGVKVADVTLPGPYGSPEFVAAYEAAVNGCSAPPRQRATEGTLAWLIEEYLVTARYADLSPSRKRSLRGELDRLKRDGGALRLAGIEVRHVEALMAMKTGPTAANTVRKNLSMLFNFAVKHGHMRTNPARHADTRKENPDGYHTWTEAEIAKFMEHHGPGTKERLALVLFLCVGASRADAVKLGWQNVTGDRIAYRRSKTGIAADLPILPELAAELARLDRGTLLFLTHTGGRPYKPETLANWFKDACKAAGLPHCTAHGLRKAGATRLAEAGATEWEVMAFLAHKTPHEAATYTKAAGRAKLADSGMKKLPPLQKTGGNEPPQPTDLEA